MRCPVNQQYTVVLDYIILYMYLIHVQLFTGYSYYTIPLKVNTTQRLSRLGRTLYSLNNSSYYYYCIVDAALCCFYFFVWWGGGGVCISAH